MDSKITFAGCGRSHAVFSKIITDVVVPRLLEEANIELSDDELKSFYDGLTKALADAASPYKLEAAVKVKKASGVPTMIAHKLPGQPYFELPENRETDGFRTSLAGFYRRRHEDAIIKAIRENNASLLSGIFDELDEADIAAKLAEKNTRGSNVKDLDVIDYLTKGQVAGVYQDADKKAALFEEYDEEYLKPFEAYKKETTKRESENHVHWHPSTNTWKVTPYEEKSVSAKAPVKAKATGATVKVEKSDVVKESPPAESFETPKKKAPVVMEVPDAPKKKRTYTKKNVVVEDIPVPVELSSADEDIPLDD